jgi:ABC-type thiamine transport system ATPase subunit
VGDIPNAFENIDKNLIRVEMLDYTEKMIATIENKLQLVARRTENISKISGNELQIKESNMIIADTSKLLYHLQQAKMFILVVEGLE